VTGTLDGEPSILGIQPQQVIEAWLALIGRSGDSVKSGNA